jgi:hypothetical protein
MSQWFKDSRGEVIPFIRIGKVVDNSDPNETGRLLVRIDGTDKLDDDNDLVPCFPLIPKFLNVYPQIDEAVFIFSYEHKTGLKTATKTKRYWIGPIISQLQNLEFENYKDALSQEIDGYTNPGKPISRIDGAKGAYPKKEDIALQGRDNTDLIFKSKEVQLRAGKFNISDDLQFNKKDPAYIQLKYGNSEIKKEFVDETIEKKIFTPPTHTINIRVNSLLPDGTILGNDLTDSEYNEADRHFVTLVVSDVTTSPVVTIETFDNGGNPYNTRTEAITALNGEIDNYIGQYEKWKILTSVQEILKKYGQQGQLSKANKMILYPNNTVTKTETTKRLKLTKVNTGKEGSVINVVATKINLLSHDGEHNFDLTDPDKLITEDMQNKINSDAHPIVYGDKLVEFLELVKNFINNHSHPYHQHVPVDGPSKTDALNFDLETILNKNINSN